MSVYRKSDDFVAKTIGRQAELLYCLAMELALGDESPEEVNIGHACAQATLALTGAIVAVCTANSQPDGIRQIAIAMLKEANLAPKPRDNLDRPCPRGMFCVHEPRCEGAANARGR